MQLVYGTRRDRREERRHLKENVCVVLRGVAWRGVAFACRSWTLLGARGRRPQKERATRAPTPARPNGSLSG